MKPLLLEFVGIGPFVGAQSLDFSRLDEKALFLIHGPTGQGKSFIFDVICYALYSETPSEREGHLKSDYLEDGIEPSVDFTFSLGPDRYRVRRTLRYDRPKKRGEGVTTQDDSHYLARVDDSGSEAVIAEKKSEVDAGIRELLGLSAGQFRQVVMIPQGQFRELLLADSGERETLLERLFDAALYGEIQQHLQESENRIRDEYDARERDADRLKAEFAGLCETGEPVPAGEGAGTGDEGEPDTEAAADFRDPDVRARFLVLRSRETEELKTAADNSGTVLAAALAEKEKASALASDHGRAVSNRSRKQQLESRRREMEELAAAVDRDEKVLALKERRDEVLRSRRELKSAEEALASAGEVLEKTSEDRRRLEKLESEVPGWQGEKERLEGQLSLLSVFRGEAGEERRFAQEKKAAETEVAEISSRTEELNTGRQELEGRRAALDEELTDGAAGKDTAGPAGDRRGRLEELAVLHDSLEGLQAELEALSGEKAAARNAKESAADRLEKLQALRDASLAGTLAASLEEGEPCPVCGSTHHPAPNESAGELPGEEELSSAETGLRDAEARVVELTTREASLTGRLEETAGRLDEGKAALGLSGEVDFRQEARRLAALESERRRIIERDIPDLLEKQRKADVELERSRTRVEAAVRRLEEKKTVWKQACDDWRSEYDSEPPATAELDDMLSLWQETVDGLETRLRRFDTDKHNLAVRIREAQATLEERSSHSDKARADRERREEALAAGLAEAGIGSEEELAGLLEQAGDIESRRRTIDEWETELKKTATLLSDLEKRIAGRGMPDLEAISADCEAKQLADARARNALAVERASLVRLEFLDGEMEKLESEGREAARRQGVLLKLSQQVRGTIPPKISLKRFFLARRLEEVLVQATRRLELLSKGRFILRRRDTGRTAASQAGLDLMVADSWTGTDRPVNTLSGGQLFMASLSLALGLADVVQARSGGVKLEALFIDEGFGTLDDEALQGVLRVLNNLRENRMVGVISHVPELRRQIADRIEVSSAEVGSAAKLVIGG